MESVQTTNNNNINIISAQNSITDEGAIRLATKILETAYEDFVRSLNSVKRAWKAKEKNPTQTIQWIYAIKRKKYEEKFYYSRWFQVLTMGKAMDTKSIVLKIEKDNEYDRNIYEK